MKRDGKRNQMRRLAMLLAVCMAMGLSQSAWGGEPQTLSLDACIAMAMERNHSRPASRFAVAAAEAQHRQVLSGYWPQVSLQGAYELMDEPRNFIFPGRSFGIPSIGFQTPASSVTIPANAFGPGFPPVDVAVPVGSQSVALPAMQFDLPDQDVRLQDEQSWYASLRGQWLLWDGGMRKGLSEQTQAGVDEAREVVRRTDLEVIDSVTRLYYGSVVTSQLKQVGKDALARMEATLSLTETMYKEGAGQVKKTDYLDNKVMVETLRSMVALLEKNEVMAQAALAYTIGLAWDDTVKPIDGEIPFEPSRMDLTALVSDAYAFSPDWKRLQAGIRAAQGSLREAKSGHSPRLALTGDLHRWWNDDDGGYATDDNKAGWTVSLGLEVPLFRGFLTRNRVLEAQQRLKKIEAERILLREGIGLQVRNIVMGIGAAEKRYQATLVAMESATVSR